MKRALISVSDKTGVVELAKSLAGLGFEIISTGGTYKAISGGGVPVRTISEITGFPECLDGRLKTLHPKIHGGLLAVRDNKSHMDYMFDLGIGMIDLLVVNLYPFKQTVLNPAATLADAIEQIDIGGPAMLRSAAKNNRFVGAAVDPADYPALLAELKEKGRLSPETGLYLAAKVFAHTAHYDCLIADYLAKAAGLGTFPQTTTFTYEKAQELRYGENPRQEAAFYREIPADGNALPGAVQLHGKELSFCNINDANGALELLKEFGETPAVVACKHAAPCGVGTGAGIAEAFAKARDCDPESIFGGIVAANGEIDEETAAGINKIFIEIVIAKSFSPKALEILKQKKNIRLLELPGIAEKRPVNALDMKKVMGGLLVQTADNGVLDEAALEFVTKRRPTESEMADLKFAFAVVKHVKSNAVVAAKNGRTIGIGGGQVNRIWACEQALDHARQNLGENAAQGAALASDGFFPFGDCVEAAHKAGITAVIHPGGSMNDKESVELCDKYGMAMVLTGMRHFKH